MPCYSYTTNSSVLQTDIEAIHAVSGLVYSYANLDWICEFPEATQFKVYTRPSALGPETLKIKDTDYTVQVTPTNTITFLAQPPVGQVVIRRKTPTDKMLYAFTDGAKLTATQLNESFTQLLFAIQENIFTGTSTTVHHTLTTGIPAWVANTPYVVNNVVTHVEGLTTTIYKCILAVTSATHPESDPSHWTSVSPSAGGFTVLNGPPNIVFDLTGFTPGHALLWNGTSFVSGQATSSLDSLSDVVVSSANVGQLLRHNGSNWVNVSPLIDLTAAAPTWGARPFLDITSSFTNGGTSITETGLSHLLEFKNGVGDWAVLDALTAYRVIAKSIPPVNISGGADPLNFFTAVNDSIDSLSDNISNPVKLKFQWDLGYSRIEALDFRAGQTSLHQAQQLAGRSSSFWDSYGDLYSVVGYNLGAAGPLKHHGVQVGNTSGLVHKVSPYYYRRLNSDESTEEVYEPKLHGYGIKSFYLSVPECHTSPLAGLPARNSDGSWYNPDIATLKADLNKIGNEQYLTSTRDYYLMGLRDMAFGGARAPTTGSTTHDKDIKARYLKGHFLAAEYDGLEAVSFLRLEGGYNQADVLWKIPSNIIYYNKAALAHADKSLTEITTATELPKNTVRFCGHSQSYGLHGNPKTTTLVNGSGYFYKADRVWNEWCDQWDNTTPGEKQHIRFNEADIDWIGKGMSSHTASSLGLYRIFGSHPPHVDQHSTASNSARLFFPWHFRPNEYRNTRSVVGGENVEGEEGYFGTHMFNIDSNCLFSQASNFIPDPVDEYVFRIVAKKTLTPLFVDAADSTRIKSSIILEYGFTDNILNASITPPTTPASNPTFLHGRRQQEEYRVMSRLDRSKVKVYVKHEQIERLFESPVNVDRYVITLAIQVPRLKSIGYCKVFRKWRANDAVYPSYANDAVEDTDIDSGPWTFPGLLPEAFISSISHTSSNFFDEVGNDIRATMYTPNINQAGKYSTYLGGGNVTGETPVETVAGRNECAVKFTRLGIPSNLWIRLSVLSTEGVKPLITNTGFHNSTDE